MWNEDNGKSDIPRNLIVSRIWSWQEIYKARNTENKPKQIHTAVSRNLIVSAKPPLTLRAILDTLWWSWVKKSFPTSIEMYVGGLIYQEKLVATSFQWAEALQRFCSRSQGVVALVSVSDGKIQITILILRRGALSSWQPFIISGEGLSHLDFPDSTLQLKRWVLVVEKVLRRRYHLQERLDVPQCIVFFSSHRQIMQESLKRHEPSCDP